MVALLGGFILLLFFIGTAIYHGFVVSVMWGWFLVPLGLPAIGIAHAIGLTSFVGLYRDVNTNSKSEHDWKESLATLAMKPIIVLGIAYVAKAFMGL